MRCLLGHVERLRLAHGVRLGSQITNTTMPPKRAGAATAAGAKKKAKGSKAASDNGAASLPKLAAAPAPDIEECGFSEAELPALRSALLAWYDSNHRILPWRRNAHSALPAEAVAAAAAAGSLPAPADLPQDRFIYYVWVCEVMSQQTQVSRAADYFRRWVARWPDVAALAAASQEEVNEVWAGLGYYRRARFLLDGAKYVTGELGGTFPRTAPELQKIPGVGTYTASAIASIACGERAAVVDGNVVRVLARLRRLGGDPRSGGMVRLFADLAASALDPARPGDFNQAVMELGATVCVPNTHPDCAACPVSEWCQAWREEREHDAGAAGAAPPLVTRFPAKVEKAAKREETVAVAVVRLLPPGAAAGDAGVGKLLLVKRPPGGLLGGLWEFPLHAIAADDGKEEAMACMDRYLQTLLGVRLVPGGNVADDGSGGDGAAPAVAGLRVLERRALGEVVHVFSHIRMTMRVEAVLLQGELPAQGAGALTPSGAPDEEGGEAAAAVVVAEEDDAEDGGGAAELMWLTSREVEARGLSSGVKKVFALFVKERQKATAGIRAFFKPPAAKA